MSEKPKGVAARAAAWIGAAQREEQEQGARKARRLAREQAERETYGPGGRPRVPVSAPEGEDA